MGFSYLGDKSWLEVSREERLFCAHLYHDIRGHESNFIEWLNARHPGLNLDAGSQWEVGYEVCFYRDLLYSMGKSAREKGYPPKRTFDLCLFSEDTIVIIEAKVHERFDKRQMKNLRRDKEQQIGQLIRETTGRESTPRVVALALASSRYLANVPELGNGDCGNRPVFANSVIDACITWREIHRLFGNDIYRVADEKYPKPRSEAPRRAS